MRSSSRIALQNQLLIDAGLVLFIVLAFVYAFFRFELEITLSLVLLVGVWWIDTYLKRIYKYYNTTAFADLSFACLVFVGSQGISWVRALDINKISSDSIARITIVSILLGFLWLGNLSICRGLFENSRNAEVQHRALLIWITSFLFSAFSVSGAIYILVKA